MQLGPFYQRPYRLSPVTLWKGSGAPASVIVHNTVDMLESVGQVRSSREESIPLIEISSAPPAFSVMVAPRAEPETPPPLYAIAPYLWQSALRCDLQGRAERSPELEKGGLDF